MSGATFGLGDSLINNENPIETMLRYALINSVVGAGAGAIGYKVAPIITSAIKKSSDIKIAVDFLKNGKVNDNLENITVTIDELSKYMPELRLFMEKVKGVKIVFTSKLPVNGKYIYQNNEIMINIKNYDKQVLPHELQHVIDLKEIMSNPNDKELQAILEANKIVTRDMNYIYDKYNDLINKCEKMLRNGKLSTSQEFEREFSEVDYVIKVKKIKEKFKQLLTFFHNFLLSYQPNLDQKVFDFLILP